MDTPSFKEDHFSRIPALDIPEHADPPNRFFYEFPLFGRLIRLRRLAALWGSYAAKPT